MINLYKNIKQLRLQNHWTQEELAQRMGYTDRSMIAKIEAGKVDLARSKIIEFAKVFDVPPGDLMDEDGWEEYTPPANTRTFVNPQSFTVTADEKKIILAYRVADDFDQRFVRRILNIDDGEKENSLNA